ncbi:MAG: hypothetical protein IH986_04170 [Planctomycetes bacterium]|nr:hypothetical protein [Planctomycetota bacterium]
MAMILWGTQHDKTQAIRIFEASPYFSQKDDVHKRKWEDRSDYQERTISKALEGLGKYDPNHPSGTGSADEGSNEDFKRQTWVMILEAISQLDDQSQQEIQEYLWDFTETASWWSDPRSVFESVPRQ